MTDSTYHPAPQRYRLKALPLCVSLFGAPVAWCVQMNLSQGLASLACYPHRMPLNLPQWPGMLASILFVDLLCMAASVASGSLALNAYRRVRHEKAEHGDAVEVGEGRTRFLTTLGMLTSLLFFIALLFSSCSFLFVRICHA